MGASPIFLGSSILLERLPSLSDKESVPGMCSNISFPFKILLFYSIIVIHDWRSFNIFMICLEMTRLNVSCVQLHNNFWLNGISRNTGEGLFRDITLSDCSLR